MTDPPRTLSERAQPLIEEAAERSRLSARARAERLRDAGRSILQATLAATIAWLVATEIVGHSQPFFAPVSAMITLGLTQGERGRRAVEVVLGVTLGIAIADLLVLELGTGWWQLALVVALSMSIALLLGSAQLFAQQAAVSAALVATLQPPDGGVSFARAVDALLGGSIALAISALVLPAHPGRIVRDAADAGARRARGGARRRRRGAGGPRPRGRRRPRSPAGAGSTSSRASSTRRWSSVARRRGWRRRATGMLGTVDTLRRGRHADRPRGAQRARARARRPARDRPRGEHPAGGRRSRCASSRPRCARWTGRSTTPARADAVREPALRAAGKATLVLQRTGNMSVTVIVGQVRSTAVDLLRGSGMSYDEAAEAVRGAVAEAEA